MKYRLLSIWTLLLVFALVAPERSNAQDGPSNLQFFPEDMSRNDVVAEMRHFSFALGVRCTHCHVRNEDGPGMNFASDENPNKETARIMLEMTRTINEELLTGLSNRDTPPVEVTCKTCHRGTDKPRLLWQEMMLAAHDGGGEAAVAKFQELRASYDNAGAYDFREWETNTVAERLAAADKHEDAIVVYMLNTERFPESDAPWSGMAESFEAMGDIPAAIDAYEKALAINKNRRDVRAKLDELKGE